MNPPVVACVNPLTTPSPAGSRIIVALDYPDAASAMAFVDRVTPDMCCLKVGFQLFIAAGPDFVRELVSRGFKVFLDLKIKDIPNTVKGSIQSIAELGVWMTNVHIDGGPKMLSAVREALDGLKGNRPLGIGVTVLTSSDDAEIAAIGYAKRQPPPFPLEHFTDPNAVGAYEEPAQTALLAVHLAGLAKTAGLNGVVCSAQEAAMMRQKFGPDFLLVTPGIRPAGGEAGDQKRIMTPTMAIMAGADHLVIGRPITAAVDPMGALTATNQEIATTLATLS